MNITAINHEQHFNQTFVTVNSVYMYMYIYIYILFELISIDLDEQLTRILNWLNIAENL
jgi:hypothetical protein